MKIKVVRVLAWLFILVWGIFLADNFAKWTVERSPTIEQLNVRSLELEVLGSEVNRQIAEQNAIISWAQAKVRQLTLSWQLLQKEWQEVYLQKQALGVFTQSQG